MSDYQAIYEGVRSRIRGGNISEAVREVLSQSFDISHLTAQANQAITSLEYEHQRPSVLFRPWVVQDGNQWCALYGKNLQEGIAGFGDSPDEACREFDREWVKPIARGVAGQVQGEG